MQMTIDATGLHRFRDYHGGPMALFRTMTTSDDLPRPGAGRETGTLDFKGDQDPGNHLGMAKDIAGFANALGGALLIGAHEDKKRGTVGRYDPMDLAKAEQLKKAYELAATQRCQPKPVIDVVRIEVGPPLAVVGNVVVVNVYPMPMGPVGVRQDTNGETFSFPLRTATHTHFLQPTELAMLMVPEIRRVAILLDSIPLAQRNPIMLRFTSRNRGSSYTATLLGVDTSLTAADFAVNDGATGSIPLDRIQSVWRQREEKWWVVAEGKIEIQGATFLYFPILD